MSTTETQTHADYASPPEFTPSALSNVNDAELPTYASARAQALPSGVSAPPLSVPTASAPLLALNPAPRTESVRSLDTTKGRPWLLLFMTSRAPTTSSLPVFFEGDEIAGRVEISLDRAEAAKGVSIRIQGGTTFVGQEEEIFYKQEQVLWTPSGKEGKLSGKYSWPFAFTLPPKVSVKHGEGRKNAEFALPPNFTERASPAYVDYKIIVTVKRGFLRVNQTLVTNVAYQPMTIPEPPSLLRRMAYADGSLIVGPDGDPDGWKVLPPVQVKGTLFNAKDVEVTCTLAIATPLSYALGAPIPLTLTLTSDDAHVLDVLAEAKAIQLLLRRSMATGLAATDDSGERRTDNTFYESCSIAYFWPSWEADASTPTKRVLQGEIEVAKTLKPSCIFPNFCIRYSLDLFPFKAAGFVSAVSTTPMEALISQPVTIVTKQIPGITPHSYAPPGYEKPKIVDYNKSLGLLENGNQRFLGHGHGHGH